jgi:hypothetical protein
MVFSSSIPSATTRYPFWATDRGDPLALDSMV